MNWETSLFLGDSITIGSRTYLGYPEYFGHYMEESSNSKWNVFNFAESGITTVELHHKMSFHFNLLKSYCPDLITILIGTNDAKVNTSLDKFEVAYRQVVLKAKILSPNSKMILLSIPNLQAGVKLPYSFRMNERIAGFNQVIQKIAADFNLEFLKLHLEKEHFVDGVHLNEEGIKYFGKQLTNWVVAIRSNQVYELPKSLVNAL